MFEILMIIFIVSVIITLIYIVKKNYDKIELLNKQIIETISSDYEKIETLNTLITKSSVELSEEQNKVKLLNNEIIKTVSELSEERKKEKKIIFWIITKPSAEDYRILEKNQDILDLFIKIIHYEIFKTTDIARWRWEQTDSNIQRNIWALNQLHELNLLLSKIKYWKQNVEDEE